MQILACKYIVCFFFYCFVLRYILFPILFNLTAFLSRLLIFFLLYTWDSIKYNPSFNVFLGGKPTPKSRVFWHECNVWRYALLFWSEGRRTSSYCYYRRWNHAINVKYGMTLKTGTDNHDNDLFCHYLYHIFLCWVRTYRKILLISHFEDMLDDYVFY